MTELSPELASQDNIDIDLIESKEDILNLPSNTQIELEFEALEREITEEHNILWYSTNDWKTYIVLNRISHYLEEEQCEFRITKTISWRELYFFEIDKLIAYLKSLSEEWDCWVQIIKWTSEIKISENNISFDEVIMEDQEVSETDVDLNFPAFPNWGDSSVGLQGIISAMQNLLNNKWSNASVDELKVLIQSALEHTTKHVEIVDNGRKFWKRIAIALFVSVLSWTSVGSYAYLDRQNPNNVFTNFFAEKLKIELFASERIAKFETDAQRKIWEIISKKISWEIKASWLIVALEKLEDEFSKYHWYHWALSEAYVSIWDFANALRCINTAISISTWADNSRYLIYKQRIANRAS